MKQIFVDTSAWDAIADSADAHHLAALRCKEELAGQYRLVVTDYLHVTALITGTRGGKVKPPPHPLTLSPYQRFVVTLFVLPLLRLQPTKGCRLPLRMLTTSLITRSYNA